jgi:hypothetical protein
VKKPVKNYLIKGVHQIDSTTWWEGSDRSVEGDLHAHYSRMNDLSEASFAHFLVGDWEIINLVSRARDVNHVFRQQFQAIYQIWNKEPCNILYCGPDTQMIKHTEVFGKYKNFLMWNYTDPRSYGPCEHYLNADIRYYPSTMRKEVWEFGLNMIDHLDWWNGDQVLYNIMVWCQGLGHEQVIDPRMAWQGFMLPKFSKEVADGWNQCRVEDAHIIHWAGSRGAARTVEIMQACHNNLGLADTSEKQKNKTVIDISHIG